MVPRTEARARISRLVEKWRGLTTAELRDYNEENTKNVFIQPLFEALGWDFHDLSQVTAEHPAGRGRVDFAFRVRGVSRFYLEAKPLRDDLIAHPQWVAQAISYAYSRGIPWTVLTNFRQLWVFTGDTKEIRFLTLTAEDYLTDFDRLSLLGRDSILSGALEREAEKVGVQPPRTPVEERLFGQLRVWREKLFAQIHLYRPDLPLLQVDETIQRLFNRLIFIRTCEDRLLEDPALTPLLRDHASRGSSGNLMENLQREFRQFDSYYDSELFARHVIDEIHIDDEVLEEILSGLYRVPGGLANYDFAAIDADILGRVYEQYLGHTAQIAARRHRELQLRLERGITPEHAVEDVIELVKLPQRRRARGIYYTPRWVVDYVVQQTVRKFIDEHNNSQDAIHEVKILDMACGSGSFLIGAYDELLRWHAVEFGRTASDIDPQERTIVLRNNIYGVDLDPQAVEIARLNLLLRALGQREALPSLADNVKAGNSLVTGSEEDLDRHFGDGWEEKRPFRWEREFPRIVDGGGFDIVLGNPPYVRIQTLDRAEANYYRSNYESAFGSFDLYVVFLEKSLELLKPGGRLGFITSGKFLKSAYGKKIQEVLRREATIEEIVDLSSQKVFGEATNYPVILIVRKGSSLETISYKAVTALDAESPVLDLTTMPDIQVGQDAITEGMWPPPIGEAATLVDRLHTGSEPLSSVAGRIFQGLITSADDVYHVHQRSDLGEETIKVHSKSLQQDLELESALLKPLLSGRHIRRYVASPEAELLLFPYVLAGHRAELIAPGVFADRYPRCWDYLQVNRTVLEGREKGKMRHDHWYAYVYPKNLALHDLRKLAIPRLVHRLQVFYDSAPEFYLDNVDVGGVLLKDSSERQYLYVMALLNSKLVDWYFQRVSAPFRGGFRSANRQFIGDLPIHRIDSALEGELQDAIVGKVDRTLALQNRLGPLRDMPGSERDQLQRAVDGVDSEIDSLVYDLYELTQAERRLIEGDSQ